MKSLQYPGVRLQQVQDPRTRDALSSMDGHLRALYEAVNSAMRTDPGRGTLRLTQPIVIPAANEVPTTARTPGDVGQLVRHGPDVYMKTGNSGEDTDWTQFSGSSTFALATVNLTAGDGLTGGGNLSANRSFDVGAGFGIIVGPNSVSFDPSVLGAYPTGTGTPNQYVKWTGTGSTLTNALISDDNTTITIRAANVTGASGGDIIVFGGDALSGNFSGGGYQQQGGTGHGSGVGGAYRTAGGAGGATGPGGDAYLVGGAGGLTSGTGGTSRVTGGQGIGALANGGDVRLLGGAPGAGGVAGKVYIQNQAGQLAALNADGITGPHTYTWPDEDGYIVIGTGLGTTNSLAKWTSFNKLGDSGVSDDGLSIGLLSGVDGNIQATVSTASNIGTSRWYLQGSSGTFHVEAGSSLTAGVAPGPIEVYAGSATAGDTSGANILLAPGGPSGVGNVGTVDILNQATSRAVSLDVSAITGNHAVAFQDAAGTLALTADLSAYQPLDSDLTSWAAVTRATGFDTFTATPSSSNLKALMTDETGSGALVFANTPTLVTPVLGVATATTINKVTLTQPTSGSTLTIADGKTFTASQTLTLTGVSGKTLTINKSLTLDGTDSTTMTFPTTSDTVAGLGTAQTFTAVNTFSSQDIHSAGIDLSTSGVVTSSVANSGTNIATVFRQTNKFGGSRPFFEVDWFNGSTNQAAFTIWGQGASGLTKEFRFYYDASNYFGFTVNSTGGAQFIATGTSTSLIFGATTTSVTSDFKLTTAGSGLYLKEGTNATMGTAVLVLGTVVVNTTKVTANSRILLTAQALGTVAVAKALAVTARTAGTSFTITSADLTDTSTVGWLIMEPA